MASKGLKNLTAKTQAAINAANNAHNTTGNGNPALEAEATRLSNDTAAVRENRRALAREANN